MYGPGFWNTIEVACWAQDGDYAHYLDMRKKSEEKGVVFGSALSPKAYELLCVALTKDMEERFEASSLT